jgi:D-alanyl-D-alanine carboxypeptidase
MTSALPSILGTMRLLLTCILILPLISYSQTDNVSAIIESKIDPQGDNPLHTILIQINHFEKNKSYNKGFGNKLSNMQPVSGNEQFKIASATKLFVSTIFLQLEEEGKLELKDKASKYLKNIDYLNFENFHIYEEKKFADEITIIQLLSHRTGLADIFTDKEEDFFQILMKDPDRQYSPRAIVELYFDFDLNRRSHFKPGEGWKYSDMNFILLGLIIEQIEEKSLAESIRNRILMPLKMDDTFLEYYEDPTHRVNLINQYVGNVNFTEVNTSFDWSGGGLISTNKDLIKFIKSLFDLKLIDKQSLRKMIEVKDTRENENPYGLGIYKSQFNGISFYGHYGFYGTYVGYSPEKKIAISYSFSQATRNFNIHNLVSEILKLTE